MPYRLAIAIIAKGSMNNLHRREVVDAFRARGVDVAFLVRENYFHLIRPLAGCRYLKCRFPEERGRVKYWRTVCRYARSLYPDGGLGLLEFGADVSTRRRLTYHGLRLLARYRLAMQYVLAMEERLYRSVSIDGFDAGEVDQLLLQGIGTHGAEHESLLTWWAKQHHKSVVHMIGNYDHLSSKGYRGAPVDHLLVWGPVMRDDAIKRHGIPVDRIRAIGAVRYDSILRDVVEDRATFLKRIGLDPGKHTILFAGSLAEYHYFEMLQAFEEFRGQDDAFQLILRIYPEKQLMMSGYMRPLIRYAQTIPGVYVSIGDPRFENSGDDAEPPEIEQAELWHAIRHCDVVVNLYSTIALEACLFDKPAVYVLYQPMRGHGWLRPPSYLDYGQLLHNRRMVGYGAIPLAHDRGELLRLIRDAVSDSDRCRQQRAYAVERELGTVDGRSCLRLAEACVEAWLKDSRRRTQEASASGWGEETAT